MLISLPCGVHQALERKEKGRDTLSSLLTSSPSAFRADFKQHMKMQQRRGWLSPLLEQRSPSLHTL